MKKLVFITLILLLHSSPSLSKSGNWFIEKGLVCECDIKNIFCPKPDKYKLFDLNPEKKIRNHFFSFENDILNKFYKTNQPFEISVDFI